MATAGLLVELSAPLTDGNSLTTVSLVWRHEFDRTVAVLMAVPVHECCCPLAGFLLVCKGSAGILRPVFGGAEQRLGIGVVVRDPGPGERTQHPELFQSHLQRGGAHGAAVVGVQDQTSLALLGDPLSEAGPADQISGHLGLLPLGDVPGDDLATPDIHHQIEVEPHAPHAGGEVGVGVGPGRPTSLSADGFPRPTLRTGRATLTASGSPQAHASASVAHGVGMRLPR